MSEQFPHRRNEVPVDDSADHEAKAIPELDSEPRLQPRIYVTAGLPLRAELTVGAWLAMDRGSDAIYAELYSVLGEPAEHDADRFYIWDHHDFGDYGVMTGALGLDDVDSIVRLAQVARGIAQYGPAFAVYADAHDEPEQWRHFADVYKGHYEDMTAFVRTMFEPLHIEQVARHGVPAAVRPFIKVDYAAIGESMLQEGDIAAIPARGGGVWVFDEQGESENTDGIFHREL